MLIRHDDRGVLAIGQASHAWISGQLARAWGNEQFGAVEPAAEVCLAAEQHDVGMAAWDLAPTRNPETGLPHSFLEMPLGVHLELWSAAPQRLLRQCRYAAVLVSMHGARLYEQRDLRRLSAEEADAVRSFLTDQGSWQERVLATFGEDPAAREELVARNSRLIWTWDFLSLAICLDWAPTTARQVPTAGVPADVQLTPGARPGQLSLDPWPLADPAVTVRCDGQRLAGPYETDDALRGALNSAPWEALEFELTPPAS